MFQDILFFILLGPPICLIGFTFFISFRFILCIFIIMSSISLSMIWLIYFYSFCSLFFYYMFSFFLFFIFFLTLNIVLIIFHLDFLFPISSLFIILFGYFLNIICSTIFLVVPLMYFVTPQSQGVSLTTRQPAEYLCHIS